MWGGCYDACGGDIMMHVGIPRVHQGMFSTLGGYHEYSRGYIVYIYHEYIGGYSVHQGDIMMHMGEQVDKILSISIENPDVLNIPDLLMIPPPPPPPMYS